MLNNIARIQRALTQAHLDAILLTDENDRRFATGFPSSDGAVIVTVHQAFFITDARYIEAARAALTGIAQVLLCSWRSCGWDTYCWGSIFPARRTI